MRIVTRPDFDGVVCAALLYEAEPITEPVKWIQPNELQKGRVEIRKGDILANLPFDDRCSMWFDHHYTNRTDQPFEGAFKIAPSAAGIVFDYYRDRFRFDYRELIRETDKIDSAELSSDEVLHPENYPYLLLSMTIVGDDIAGESYWNRLIELIRKYPIARILEDPEVQRRCRAVIDQNKVYKEYLLKYSRVIEHVSVTDFRPLGKTPAGNRFLVYSLFPQTFVSVKIRYDDDAGKRIAVSVGHSIFNRKCQVNVGLMLSNFEGGGHRGAGSCRFSAEKAPAYIPKILEILIRNETNEN